MILLCCFLPCKGTNFSANHNYSDSASTSAAVVSYPAKVQIFQLITTYLGFFRCLEFVVSYPAKVQIFQLITTGGLGLIPGSTVVSYPAKVQIFQLITTGDGINTMMPWLFLTLQRYKFFS